MKKFLLILATVLILGGCANYVQPQNPANGSSDQTSMAASQFDYKKIQVGDKILGMTVAYIGPADQNLPISDSNFNVSFYGQATVSGDYQNNGTQSMGPGICFSNLDQKSIDALPEAINAQPRGLAFCFRDDQATNKAFAPEGSQGHATVIIDNFSYEMSPGEGANMVDLVKLVSKS